MEDGDLIAALGDNSRECASAFCQKHTEANVDIGLMHTWFANAMIASIPDCIRLVKTGEHGEHREYMIKKGAEPSWTIQITQLPVGPDRFSAILGDLKEQS